jgi:hypothetical protein
MCLSFRPPWKGLGDEGKFAANHFVFDRLRLRGATQGHRRRRITRLKAIPNQVGRAWQLNPLKSGSWPS